MEVTGALIEKTITLEDEHELRIVKLMHYSGKVRRAWPYHSHDYCEISFVFHGGNLLRLNNGYYPFGGNEISIISPGTIHGIAMKRETGKAPQEESDDIWELDISWPEQWRFFPESGGSAAQGCQQGAIIAPMKEKANSLQLLLTRLQTRLQSPEGWDAMTRATILVLLDLAGDCAGHTEARHIPYIVSPCVEDVMRYISDHCGDNITLDSLTEHFCISRSHLSRLFTQHFGISPISQRIEMQISNATILLTDTGLTVQEIAGQLGFGNVTYFTKAFTQKMGISPGEFRKKFKTDIKNM